MPVPHFGMALQVEQFHELAQRVKEAGIRFIIEPHVRFEGKPLKRLHPSIAVLLCTASKESAELLALLALCFV